MKFNVLCWILINWITWLNIVLTIVICQIIQKFMLIGFTLVPGSFIIIISFKNKIGFSLIYLNFSLFCRYFLYLEVLLKLKREEGQKRIKSSSVGSSCFVLTVSHMYCHPLLSGRRGVAEPVLFLLSLPPCVREEIDSWLHLGKQSSDGSISLEWLCRFINHLFTLECRARNIDLRFDVPVK